MGDRIGVIWGGRIRWDLGEGSGERLGGYIGEDMGEGVGEDFESFCEDELCGRVTEEGGLGEVGVCFRMVVGDAGAVGIGVAE